MSPFVTSIALLDQPIIVITWYFKRNVLDVYCITVGRAKGLVVSRTAVCY